ncbi:hypothetical protein [Halobacillus sp. H74]|uniref:hypothetical protein n=1 Tax=Halobacillus sp. H74 TaxID=3457436 RepID=UPI003FCE18C1
MDKTVFWLNRKYKQADRELYEERRFQADGIQKGITIVLDIVFNEGKEADKILPSYEEAIQRLKDHKKEQNQEKFVTTMWWKPGQ